MIFADTNILPRSPQTAEPHYATTETALAKLRNRQETLCIAPQNIVEFWSVATRLPNDNGLGMSSSKAATEIAALLRLFHLLPYRVEVHSITSILTFNDVHSRRYPGITALDPAQV